MEVVISRDKVETLLKEKGMTKAEFALRMGIKRQNVDVLLDSKKKDINTVIRIAESLGIPFEEFIGLKQDDRPQILGFIRYEGHFYEITSKEDIEEFLRILN